MKSGKISKDGKKSLHSQTDFIIMDSAIRNGVANEKREIVLLFFVNKSVHGPKVVQVISMSQ